MQSILLVDKQEKPTSTLESIKRSEPIQRPMIDVSENTIMMKKKKSLCVG